MAALGTGSSGLDYEEAAERLGRDGQNTLPRVSGRRWYLEFIANFIHLFALLLWTGAGLAWLAGMPQLAWAIVAVIIINGCFSYWQEYQAERAVEALEALLPRRVTVRRCGRELLVEAAEVVRGDVLVLSEGQAIPADARVVLSERLRVDTSSLTGESRPAPRYSASAPIVNGPLAVLPNLVFAGTSVASGRGEAVVFATGAGTEFGRIAKLTQAQRERQSPLELELRRVTRFVTMLALAFGLIFFIIGTSAGGLTRTEAFLFAIGIIVANVPEGLLPTLTLALALGVRRMARRNALVKRLSAVESLGAATIILTDKTGTLTENEMTVRELWTPDGDYALSGAGYDLDGRLEKRHSDGDESDAIELIRVAALCCDAHLTDESDAQEESQKAAHHKIRAIGDPTEAAIIVAAGKAGLSDNALKAWPRLSELPFDSTRKRMTTIQRIEGLPVACVKGAPSEIFP
jgi:magnesium-transporting ATPase (P-type)